MADTRNTPLLEQILEVVGDLVVERVEALARLEEHFQHRYVLDAGSIEFVAEAAAQLRYRITQAEYAGILDYIAQKAMVGITIDHVEQAINELLGEERFSELGFDRPPTP